MTLTAAYRNDGYPVVIADLLLSSRAGPIPNKTPAGISIDPGILLVDGNRPANFSQKIAILQKNVAATFSGEVARSKYNLTKLRNLLKHNTADQAIKIWSAGLSSADLEKSTITLLAVMNGISCIMPFGNHWEKGSDRSGQEYIASGSGMNWLRQFSSVAKEAYEVKGVFHPSEKMYINVIATGGQALIDEIIFGIKRQAFGGGWQTAWFNGEEFKFIDDILYVVWFCWHDSKGKPIDMQSYNKMIRVVYEGSYLYFDQWEFQQPWLKRDARRLSCITPARVLSTVVNPALADGVPASPRTTTIQTPERIFHCIIRMSDDKIVDRSLWSSAGDTKMSPLKFAQMGSNCKISMQRNFYDKLMNIPLRWDWRDGGLPIGL